jgi:hypothetical protein
MDSKRLGSPLSESGLNVKKGLTEAELSQFNNLCIIVGQSNFLLVVPNSQPLVLEMHPRVTIHTTEEPS